MTTPKTVITTTNLVKRFGRTVALNGLDMEVCAGEVHGLLGPNGAGKSTVIRILLGLLRTSDGEATLFNADPWHDAVELHRRLAYVPGDVSLWESLSGGEIIDLLVSLRGEIDTQRRQYLIERFQLDPTKKFRTYSKGNRQKVALVAALACDVELYILDEPTSGLDPLLELVFQEEIKALKAQGKTILLSSHILAEVEALCDRVTIIREGRVVESGSLDDMRHLARTTISVRSQQTLTGLRQLAGIHDLQLDDTAATFEVEADHLAAAMAFLSQQNITALTAHPPTLEELFMGHYQHQDSPRD